MAAPHIPEVPVQPGTPIPSFQLFLFIPCPACSSQHQFQSRQERWLWLTGIWALALLAIRMFLAINLLLFWSICRAMGHSST